MSSTRIKLILLIIWLDNRIMGHSVENLEWARELRGELMKRKLMGVNLR